MSDAYMLNPLEYGLSYCTECQEDHEYCTFVTTSL